MVSGKVDNPTFHSESRMSSDVERVTLRSEAEEPYSTKLSILPESRFPFISVSGAGIASDHHLCLSRKKSTTSVLACLSIPMAREHEETRLVCPTCSRQFARMSVLSDPFCNCRWMRLMVAWYSDALKRHSHVHDVSRFRISSRKKACSGCAR